MAKRRHEEEQTSSKGAMAAMIGGGIAVTALVVWALTRTVQPVPSDTPIAVDQPVATNTMATNTIATNTAAPIPGDTAGYQPAPATGTPATTSTYAPNPPTADESASVQRISVAELRPKIDTKQVMVIDVRDKTSYITSHIPGSYHIPMATVESQVTSIPKDKPIVTYCT